MRFKLSSYFCQYIHIVCYCQCHLHNADTNSNNNSNVFVIIMMIIIIIVIVEPIITVHQGKLMQPELHLNFHIFQLLIYLFK